MILGRADTGGTNDTDVDLEIVDPNSVISPIENSLSFNASQAEFSLGSGSSSFPGEDGNLLLENGEGDILIDIEGISGNIYRDVDPIIPGNGNGAIKGWAKINSTGTLFTCWRCNPSTSETRKLTTGQYEVDFEIGNISLRPCLVSVGDHFTSNNVPRIAECFASSDLSSKIVETSDTSGVNADSDFTIIIF